MAKVIIDELVRDAFIFENQTPAVGLLIGTYNETNEFCVAHLAQTLEEIEPEVEVEEDNVNDRSFQLQPKSFTEIKLASISHHAKQVIRMLPGGLVVLGIFVVEPVENIFTTKYEGIIKSILTVMNKSLSRNPHYGVDFGEGNEKLVIHFQPSTKKFTVKVVNCQTFKTRQMDPAFKQLEWSKLECEYDTFYGMHLAKADVGVPLIRNMKILMDTFQESLNSAEFIIQGKEPSKNEVYVEHVSKIHESGMSDAEDDVKGDNSESTGGSGSSSPRHHSSDSGNESESENPQNRPISVLHILVDKTPGVLRVTSPGQDFVTHLHLQGKIAVAAFVLSGCSTAFVVEKVKQDILRSLTSRIEMHCESLIEEEQGAQAQIEEGATKVYHEVPRRVFANLLGSKLLVSDYLFPGEGPKDSVVSFRDILSLRLDDETDIIMTKEKPFDLDELRSKGSLEELICQVEPMVASSIQRRSAVGLGVAVTIVVGILAILVTYFLRRLD